jgi:hypothetical protein
MPERSTRQLWTLPGLPFHAAAGAGVASLVHLAHGSPLEITVALIAPCATCALAIFSCFLATRCFASEPEAALGISERKIEVEVKSLASVRIHTLYGQSAAKPGGTPGAHSKAIKATPNGRGARRHLSSRTQAQVPRQRSARGTPPGLAAHGSSPASHRRRHHAA